jgi:serine/threonine-protein kinase
MTMKARPVGPYELIEKIGQGGMAEVYKARHAGEGRIVALKILTSSAASDPQVVFRFQREARLLLRLRHPNIVPVEDFRVEDGLVYLVMPYYPAGSLADRLARGDLTPQEGGRLIAQVCAALDYAHRQGIVHRDVKPSNILIDEAGNARLTDFGLAHVADASLSLTGASVLGTPSYLSPEQVQARPVDARSDQYSLGVVLYLMTTGRLPFEAETPMAVLIQHVNDPMPAPRSVSPAVPEAVERVILKATAKDPRDRFSSIAELNAAFQAALAHALDPKGHRAPVIPLGPTSRDSHARTTAGPTRRGGRRLLLGAVLGSAALLVFFVRPVAAPVLLELLLGPSGPAEGAVTSGDLNDPQRTAMAQTQNAFATQLIGTWSGTLLPEQALTAAAQTIAVEWAVPTATPIPDQSTALTVPSEETTATSTTTRTTTPTRTSAAPSGPSATDVPTSTRSDTPTSTFTASPTVTPTPSRTATKTSTRTATPSRTPSTTPATVLPSIPPTSSATSAPTMPSPGPTDDGTT